MLFITCLTGKWHFEQDTGPDDLKKWVILWGFFFWYNFIFDSGSFKLIVVQVNNANNRPNRKHLLYEDLWEKKDVNWNDYVVVDLGMNQFLPFFGHFSELWLLLVTVKGSGCVGGTWEILFYFKDSIFCF